MRNQYHPETHPFGRPSILLIHEPSLHTKRTKGVSHCDLALKSMAKEKFMEIQIFHHAKNIIFPKSSKRNQNPSRYYNSIN
jgi:hypothetical protein